MQVRAHRRVEVPVDQVWAGLSEHTAMTGWAPGLVVSLDREGDTERNGVGAVRRIKAPGPAPAIVERVTGFEPGRRLAYEAISGVPFKNYSGEVVLTDLGGTATSIVWTLSADQRLPVPLEKAPMAAAVQGLITLLVRSLR